VYKLVQFYIANAPTLVAEVGYVALPTRVYELGAARFKARTTGSVFADAEGGSLESVLGSK